MRIVFVAGNWKMNLTASEVDAFIQDFLSHYTPNDKAQMMIAAPALYLDRLMTLKSLGVLVAAQDCSMHSKGAFTGEISAGQLASLGVQACVLGHSERRQYHQETDEKVALKVKQCLDAGLLPIYCCGEMVEEREAGRQNEVVKKQLLTALGGLSDDEMRKVVVAYEPVWAIGTGKTASNEQAQEMHEFIRAVLADAFDDNTAMSVSILYGGSMNPANAAGLIACPDVDGGLIGGASLKVDDFLAIQQSV